MNIKAIAFDIGNTLIKYNNPLNWKSLYAVALQKVMSDCKIIITDKKIDLAVDVLTKYNTRENYREYEVSSDTIFREIFDKWEQGYQNINEAKKAFYGFFQSEAVCYDDTKATLIGLCKRGIKLGFLTDVAYGMDNEYSLNDISDIKDYFNIGFTSVDVGFRKPNEAGFKLLLKHLDVSPHQMMYVGDEEKDIIGANNVGIISVLINRSNEVKNWGQKYTIQNLIEILSENEYVIDTAETLEKSFEEIIKIVDLNEKEI